MLKEDLNKLSTNDIYSLILFAILQLRKDPNYAVLSELIYSVDENSLLNLCRHFGGMTITIPTTEELDTVINALLLYCYTQLEHKDFDYAITLLNKDDCDIDKVTEVYEHIIGIVADYDFRRF